MLLNFTVRCWLMLAPALAVIVVLKEAPFIALMTLALVTAALAWAYLRLTRALIGLERPFIL